MGTADKKTRVTSPTLQHRTPSVQKKAKLVGQGVSQFEAPVTLLVPNAPMNPRYSLLIFEPTCSLSIAASETDFRWPDIGNQVAVSET